MIRTLLLRAAVVWGVLLAAITELLSLFHALTPGAIAAAWAVVGIALAAAWRLRPRAAAFAWRPERPSTPAVLMALPIAIIVLGTGVSAAAGWPNQWDSLVYHQSRVDHWILNRGVQFYPTHIVRQLYNPPGAEYAILHALALGGDERWANAPQWLAMAGSLVGVSAIAGRLGAGPRGQLVAALFAATIPMGILQASGTQNDYLVAFWLVCLAEAALSPPSPGRTFRLGGALGLALLAKGTALLYAGPLLLLMPDWRNLRRAGAILLLAAALNGAHWARNLETFGWPLGPRDPGSAGGVGDKLTNDAVTPGILASNLIRNLTLHAGTPFRRVNQGLEAAVVRGHDWLGLAVDDPRSTRLYSDRRYSIVADAANPDRTGNPVHLLLILAAGLQLAASRSLRRAPGVARYGLALGAAFLIFCLVLKWQPWHSRLQLPLFVLAAPLIGVAGEVSYRLLLPAAALLGALSLRPLLQNRLAPLAGKYTVFNTPRLQQYFQSFGPEPSPRQRAYVAAADLLRGRRCAEVGALLGWDDWEHPLWVLLAGPTGAGPRIEHVAVTNPSARRSRRGAEFVPCGIVVGGVPVGDSIEVEGRAYRLARAGEGLRVFLPAGRPAVEVRR